MVTKQDPDKGREDSLEARVAKLEARFERTLPTLATKADLKRGFGEIRNNISMKGWMVATTLTIAGFTWAAIFAVGQVNKAPPPASAPINITIPGLQAAPAPAPR